MVRKICIIGSGIGVLSAAYLLSQCTQDAEVHVFEAEANLGMDAHSVDIALEGGSGAQVRLDAPPRAFSLEFHENLWSLYRHAGVEVKKFDWRFTCVVENSPKAYFKSGE
jgi:predicted NAD/FAD-binding protein